MTLKPKKSDKNHSDPTTRIEHHSVSVSKYEGPIPDPASLQQYENIQPGFAERLLKMAELEQAERHKTQKEVLAIGKITDESNLANQRYGLVNQRIGQLLGFGAVVLVVTLCGYAFWLGYKEEGKTVATSVIIGVAAIFVVGRIIRRKSSGESE